MADGWRREKRDGFGWSVEGRSSVKAFWLPAVEFANPDAGVHGQMAAATAGVLAQQLDRYAAEVRPRRNLRRALRTGALHAAGVADELGGGYLVVLPKGSGFDWDFRTIAWAGPRRWWELLF